MTYNRWDVVSVDFPFVEGVEAKRRPGAILVKDRTAVLSLMKKFAP